MTHSSNYPIKVELVEGISKKNNQPYMYISVIINDYRLTPIFLDHKDKHILSDWINKERNK